MDARQIMLVKDSFIDCVAIPDVVAGTFYRRLFASAPETRRLFSTDMLAQGRKLVMTLAAIVDSLERLGEIVPMIQQLAVRHVGYGVTDRHYVIVGRVLIETLRELLGPRFSLQVEAAWLAAYGLVADTMLAAARRTGDRA